MSEELELKFLVEDLAGAKAWLERRFGASGWRTIAMTDRYFDTADNALGSAGYGARLRQGGRQITVTIKSDIEVGAGLHRREELEGPAKRALNPVRWPHSEARARVLEVAGARRLIERFRVEGERHEIEAHVGQAVVVVSLDDARVVASGRVAGPFKQLEAELRSGPESGLHALADEIAAAGIAVAESRSKLVIAAGMAETAARVLPTDPMAVAGRLALRRQLMRMLERETAARAGDPLAIKQMRVATRRMRTAWREFGAAYKKGARRRYVAELRRVAAALGEVRDMDVLRDALPADAALAPLAETWRDRRAAAHERLVSLLDDAAYDEFVGDYLDFTADPRAAMRRGASSETLAEVAPALLVAGANEVRVAAAAALAGGDEVAWHTLRRGARRLRYSVESLREGIGEAAAAAAIARLVSVQDALGAMNDAAVAAREVEQWLATNAAASPETVAAATAFARKQRDEIARLRQSFAPIWQGAANLFTER